MAHPSLARFDHRPWPLPGKRWVWRQTWTDLLFAHWPVPVAALRPLVPDGLAIRQQDGIGWIGVVPFRMGGTRRPFPFVPFLSSFPEVNVRTYVEKDGKPGVWFLSLDADSLFTVWFARRYFHLPYHKATMNISHCDGWTRLGSERRGASGTVRFNCMYRPISDPREAEPGSLDSFLAENYRLYSADPAGRLHSIDVHHAPWPLQRAEAKLEAESLFRALGLDLGGGPSHLHYSRGVDVVAWDMEPA